jgi:hypothetical protein
VKVFCIFVRNISQKQKESFRERTKTKTFVPTLTGTYVLLAEWPKGYMESHVILRQEAF